MIINRARDLYRQLPIGLRHIILVRRRASLWREAGIVFVHIPKAAGTSINEALYGRFMGHPPASVIKRWAPGDVVKLPSFAVTRNPWARLVSAYRFAKLGVGAEGIAGMRKPGDYAVHAFESFERFVREWLTVKDLIDLDGVFQPQWRFVCDDDKAVIVDHVGRLDDLQSTYAYIESLTGRRTQLRSINRSGPPVDYREFYTPQLVKLVGDIYRDDIRIFGYDF